MKLEIEIPDDWKDRFAKVKIPAEHCGPTMEEQIVFFIGSQLDHAESAARRHDSLKLHRQFGVAHPLDDDGPDF